MGDKSLINHSFQVLDLTFKWSDVNSLGDPLPWNQCEDQVWARSATRRNRRMNQESERGTSTKITENNHH